MSHSIKKRRSSLYEIRNHQNTNDYDVTYTPPASNTSNNSLRALKASNSLEFNSSNNNENKLKAKLKKIGSQSPSSPGSSPSSSSSTSKSLDLSLSDCTCPICLEILIEPVVLPCKHEFCLPCYKNMMDKTNFLCPMCRLRISSWSRLASNANSLVNLERWKQIQKAFPIEIKNRIEGKTAILLSESIKKQKELLVTHSRELIYSKPGEIRKEYLDYLKREEERLRAEKENEEKMSLDYIQKVIQEEESVPFSEYMRLIAERNRNNSSSIVGSSGSSSGTNRFHHDTMANQLSLNSINNTTNSQVNSQVNSITQPTTLHSTSTQQTPVNSNLVANTISLRNRAQTNTTSASTSSSNNNNNNNNSNQPSSQPSTSLTTPNIQPSTSLTTPSLQTSTSPNPDSSKRVTRSKKAKNAADESNQCETILSKLRPRPSLKRTHDDAKTIRTNLNTRSGTNNNNNQHKAGTSRADCTIIIDEPTTSAASSSSSSTSQIDETPLPPRPKRSTKSKTTPPVSASSTLDSLESSQNNNLSSLSENPDSSSASSSSLSSKIRKPTESKYVRSARLRF